MIGTKIDRVGRRNNGGTTRGLAAVSENAKKRKREGENKE